MVAETEIASTKLIEFSALILVVMEDGLGHSIKVYQRTEYITES